MDGNDRSDGIESPLAREPLESLENQITELAGHMHAATYRLLVLIAEYDRREAWAPFGILSCAHWLNWKCGIGLVAAREKVRVAHALERLPRISEAFRKGELSYSKVRAMVRVATRENEEYLLHLARHGTAAHVERLVSAYRRVQRNAETQRANAVHDGRSVHYHHDEDGAMVLSARLSPEVGALVVKALDAASEALYRKARHDDSAESMPRSHAARRADALALMAESFLANGAATRAGGDRQQVIVHVDAECLLEDDAYGRAEVDQGPWIACETVRRLACDGGIVAMVEDRDGRPLDVGRKTRSIPPAVRRALASRDRGCRFPGCTNRHFVEGHHIVHWASGGATRLDNLVQLCHHHHRGVHEEGFGVRYLDADEFEFTQPDGSVIEVCPALDSAESSSHPDIESLNHGCGLVIDERTCPSLRDGTAMDYNMAICALLYDDGASSTGINATRPAIREPR